jgi:glycosyltransferase involved in cell wall biosynthesis
MQQEQENGIKTTSLNVCIITFPIVKSGCSPLSNLVNLNSKLVGKVFVISSSILEDMDFDPNVQTILINHGTSSKAFIRIIKYLHTQLKILCRVLAISGNADIFIFFIGGQNLLFSILTLKLLRKKVVLMPADITARVKFPKKDPLFKFLSLLSGLDFGLAEEIILYSPMMIRKANLAKYRHKIIIAHEHFVDFSKFTIKKTINERSNLVGYVGRLSEEKGILNLIDAMPLVLKKKAEIQFMICGEGSLADQIGRKIKAGNLEAITKLIKWIPHDDVPRYLNEFKLLVLPSSTEGLPNILLEAMACGTPVLATPVGAIPDIIRDGQNGFLLMSNNPEHIADKTAKILNNSGLLEKVSTNAFEYVRQEFNEQKALESWRRILANKIDDIQQVMC